MPRASDREQDHGSESGAAGELTTNDSHQDEEDGPRLRIRPRLGGGNDRNRLRACTVKKTLSTTLSQAGLDVLKPPTHWLPWEGSGQASRLKGSRLKRRRLHTHLGGTPWRNTQSLPQPGQQLRNKGRERGKDLRAREEFTVIHVNEWKQEGQTIQ